MAMQQCANGHVYDDQKNPVCPYCTGSGNVGVARPLNGNIPQGGNAPLGGNAPPFPKTAPLQNNPAPFPKTSPVAASAIPKTMPLDNPETNKTMALNLNEKGIDPVRGWLICTDGAKKGKDFRICGEKNFIGRLKSNDVCLDFDDSISKEANAIISYDSRHNKFFIQQGEGKNNIYVNENLLLAPIELSDYDVIEIGKTKLVFRSLCNDSFKWE
ncbi:MAG: FHA domain-containing protein [Oscillospiraceae bacterium]|nr:FHA domain-containing protein [Oscillospiraceae bacterium]